MAADAFTNRVLHRLDEQARRLRRCRLIEGLGVVVGAIFAIACLDLALDWSFRFRIDTRAVLLGLILAGVAVVLWRFAIAPLRLRFGAMEIAGLLERRFPQLDALLISAVQFHAGQTGNPASNSPQLVAAVVDRAARQTESLPFEELIDVRRARRSGFAILGVVVVSAMAFAVAPELMGTWFERNVLLSDTAWPKRTQLVVDVPEDGIIRGAIGDELEIRASVAPGYEVPRQVEIVFETRSGRTGRENMTGVGSRGFRATFSRVREEFRFRLIGGDDVTDWYDTHLSERPQVATAMLTVDPPAYTRIEPFTLPEGQRAAELYPGSRLTIDFTCTKPIASATLMVGAEAIGEAEPSGDGFTVTVAPTESQTYHFDLVDLDHLRNNRPVRFSARLIPDAAPKAKLRLPNVGNLVTESAVLPVEAEFSDQLGLAEVVVLYNISSQDGSPQSVAMEGFEPGQKTYDAALEWPVASIGAAVGDQVSVFAQARDFDDVSGPNSGESATITFRVASQEELMAEFARREQELRRQFQRVVESQERLRSDLLTLLGRMNEPSVLSDLEVMLAPEERRQRQVLAQVNIIRQQFEQLLTERRINRLDSTEIVERMTGGVIEPLTELATRDLSDAADLLRRLGRDRSVDTARTVDPLQARILARMQFVLDNMLKWEGYQETVTMLRDILRLQKELRDETEQEIERQGSELFDD